MNRKRYVQICVFSSLTLLLFLGSFAGALDTKQNNSILGEIYVKKPVKVTSSNTELTWEIKDVPTNENITYYWAVGYNGDVTYEDGYIHRGISDDSFIALSTLEPRTRYFFRVRASTGEGVEICGYSEAMAFTTSIAVPVGWDMETWTWDGNPTDWDHIGESSDGCGFISAGTTNPLGCGPPGSSNCRNIWERGDHQEHPQTYGCYAINCIGDQPDNMDPVEQSYWWWQTLESPGSGGWDLHSAGKDMCYVKPCTDCDPNNLYYEIWMGDDVYISSSAYNLCYTECGELGPTDNLYIYYSTNGGTSWFNFYTASTLPEVWTYREVGLAAFSGSNVRFKFVLEASVIVCHDGMRKNYAGWWIDDIAITEAFTPGAVENEIHTLCYEGGSVTPALYVEPSGGYGGTIKYRWFNEDSEPATDWNTTLEFNPTPPLESGIYRCYSRCGPSWGIMGGELTINVTPPFDNGRVSGDTAAFCSGGDPEELECTGTGGSEIRFRWYWNNDTLPPETYDFDGRTDWQDTNVYDPDPIISTRTYRCLVDDVGIPDCSGPTWSDGHITASVRDPFLPGRITGGSGFVPPGGDPDEMTCSGSGGSEIRYKWYWKNGFECPELDDYTGATAWLETNVYDPPPLTTTRTYRCLVDDIGAPDCGDTTWSDSCITVNVQYEVRFRATTIGHHSLRPGNVAVITMDGDNYYAWDGHDVVLYLDDGSTHYYTYGTLSTASTSEHRWMITDPTSGVIYTTTNVTGIYQEQVYLTVTSDHASPSGTGWYNVGNPVNVSITSPAEATEDTRYRCNGWTGTGSVPATGDTNFISFTIDTVSTITWSWIIQYHLDMETNFGTVTPGDSWHDAGTVVNINASPPAAGSGERYTWLGWAGTGTISYTGTNNPWVVTMNSPITQTAAWRHEFRLMVISAHDTPSPPIGINWIEAGTSVNAWVTSPCEIADSVRWRCTGWNGTGSVPVSGTGTNVSFFMYSASTVDWLWIRQFYLTMRTNYGTVLPGGGWYDEGDAVNIDALAPSGEPGERFNWNGWLGSGDGSYTGPTRNTYISMDTVVSQTASWTHQLYLTMLTNFGTVTPVSGWYNEGAEIIIEATAPGIAFEGERYTWTGWAGTGDSSYTGNDNPASFTIFTPVTQTSHWRRELKLTIFSDYGSATPPIGENWIEAGTIVNASVDSTAMVTDSTRRYCRGFTGTGSPPPTGTENWTLFVMDTVSSITWLWVKQYKLVMISEFGFLIPGDTTWHNEGSAVLISAIPPIPDDGERFIFLGWTGTGTVSYTGLSNPANVIMNSAIVEEVHWQHQFYLTMYTNYGTVSPESGWHDAGTVLTIDAEPPDTATGVRYEWVGWTGHGTISYTGPDTSHSITMNSAVAESAYWSLEVTLTVTSPYGTPIPGVGTHWFPAGTEINASVDSAIAVRPGIRRHCEGWNGSGSVPATGTSNSFTFTIAEPSEIQWIWVTEFLLTMLADTGTLIPGTTWQDSGAVVNIQAYPPAIADGERFLWNGWVGVGAGSYTGIDNPADINMDAPITETASWIHQYRLLVSSPHDSPVPSEGVHYFDVGTEINAHVTSPADSSEGTRYRCTGWTGTGSVPAAGTDTIVVFNLNMSSSISWNWMTQYLLTMTTDLDSVTPGTGWYDEGTVVHIESIEHPPVDGERYDWLGWRGSGTVSYSGMNNPDSVIMLSPIQEHAEYFQEFRLNVASPHDSPDPSVGEHWYEDGTEINAFVNPFADTLVETRYRCTGWNGSGSVPGTGDTSAFTFNITEPSELNWLWILQYYFEIITEHSVPCPEAMGWFDSASYVRGCVEDSAVTFGDTMRYYFTHWSMDASGDLYYASDSILLDLPRDAQANWVKQYHLELDYTGCGAAIPTQVGEGWYPTGTWVEISTEDPVFMGIIPYHFARWHTDAIILDSLSCSTSVYIDGPHTATAVYSVGAVGVIVQTDFAGGAVEVDAAAHASPCTLVWDAGSEHQIAVDSIQYPVPGTRYIFTGWSDFGALSHNVIADRDTTFTAFFDLEYSFVVNSDYGNPEPSVGTYWFEPGTAIDGFVNYLDTVSHHYCTGYTGTGDLSPSSTDTTFAFILNNPASITWEWASQLSLIQNSEPWEPIPGDTAWYFPGTGITVNVPEIIYETPEIRYIFEGWTATGITPSSGDSNSITFTIEVNTTITWHWRKELLFQVFNPDRWDSPDPRTGMHWYTAFDTVIGWVDSPVFDTIYCTGFTGLGSLPSASSDSFWFVITEPSSVIWNWTIVPSGSELETLWVYSEYGHPMPVGMAIFPWGTAITAVVEDSVFEGGAWHYCSGWTAGGSPPSEGEANVVNFTITEASWIVWQWDRTIRYPFTVNNPLGYDTPVPSAGIHWYDVGVLIEGHADWMTIVRTDTFFCAGYEGTGSLYDELDTSFAFNIFMPSSVTWLWVYIGDAVTLDVFSDHDDPYPSVGRHYYFPGTMIYANVDETAAIEDGARYRCTGWTGTVDVPLTGDSTSVNFRLNRASTITWNWILEYRFVVNTTHGSPEPPIGTYWYEDGIEINGWINQFDGTWMCTGYDGSGSLGDAPDTFFTFVIDAPSSVTWEWVDLAGSVVLQVESEYGDPEPPAGIYYYTAGTPITASMPDTIEEAGNIRWICTGWTGTGSAPAGGGYFLFNFIIDVNSSITWNWKTQYHIIVDYSGTDGFIPYQTGEGWYDVGSDCPVTTQPMTGDEDTVYFFVEWVSDPRGAVFADETEDSTDFTVDFPYAITANYVRAIKCVIKKIPYHPTGIIFFDDSSVTDTGEVTLFWLPGSYHTVGVSHTDSSDSMVLVFIDWENGLIDTIRTIGPLVSDTTLIAYYEAYHHCIIRKNPLQPYGYLKVDRTPYWGIASMEQHFWWEEGTTHEIEASDEDYEGDTTRYIYEYWSDGGSRHHVTDPITEPTVFTAYYGKQFHCLIAKDPPEPYGTITFEDSTYEGIGTYEFWADDGQTYYMGVSDLDVSDDSLYIFLNWNDGGDLYHNTLPIYAPSRFIAYYHSLFLILRVCLTENEWYVDTMDPGEVERMDPEDIITVSNCGNIGVDFGLRVASSGDYWSVGYSPGPDIYSLRAEFTESDTSPSAFHPATDNVKTSITWASEYIFGPYGYEIPVAGEYNLWLEFYSPFSSSIYGREQTIVLLVSVRVNLP
ncbi:hypothetical protein JXI42_08970 [bacterium]|nr:hypothetical protein [bacterium]